MAGDQRVFRALVEEAGAACAADVHQLLEMAKAQAVPRSRPAGSGGLAVLTCSGGDSALAADECERLGVRLPPLRDATSRRLRELLPEAATVANPLDYTADLGRGRDAARHRRRGRLGPGDRPGARALRPAGRDRGGPGRVERALGSPRGAPLITGGRGRTPLDLAAAARLASGVGEVQIESGLSLVELNPVFVYESGAVAVDAVAG